MDAPRLPPSAMAWSRLNGRETDRRAERGPSTTERTPAPARNDDLELGFARHPAAEPTPAAAQRTRTAAQIHPPTVSSVVPLRDSYPLLRTVPRALYACAASALALEAALPVEDPLVRSGLTLGTGIAVGMAGLAAAVDVVTGVVDAGAACLDRAKSRYGEATAESQMNAIVVQMWRRSREKCTTEIVEGAIQRLREVQKNHPEEIDPACLAKWVAKLAKFSTAETFRLVTSTITHMYRRGEISRDDMVAAMAEMLARPFQHDGWEDNVIAAVAAAPQNRSDCQDALVRLCWTTPRTNLFSVQRFAYRICDHLRQLEDGTPAERLAKALVRLFAPPGTETGPAPEGRPPAAAVEPASFPGRAMTLNDDDDGFDGPVRIHVADGKHGRRAPAQDLQAWVEESPATRAASTPG